MSRSNTKPGFHLVVFNSGWEGIYMKIYVYIYISKYIYINIPWKYDAGSNRTYVYDCICMYITNNMIDLYDIFAWKRREIFLGPRSHDKKKHIQKLKRTILQWWMEGVVQIYRSWGKGGPQSSYELIYKAIYITLDIYIYIHIYIHTYHIIIYIYMYIYIYVPENSKFL